MVLTRVALVFAAAVCTAAVATPVLAQESAQTRHTKYAHPAKYEQATAEVQESSCRVEDFDTGVHWHSLVTMCGPR